MTSEANVIVIHLPWPARELSPNARVHWAKKARAARHARCTAWALTLKAMRGVDLQHELAQAETVELRVTFFPPDRRRRDDDNLIAALKPSRDGIADALGIDDQYFRVTPSLGTETVRGGMVRVEVVV